MVLKTTPVTFRLSSEYLTFLRELAQAKTLGSGKQVTVSDLIQHAVLSKYPIPIDFKVGDMLFIYASGVYCGR